MLGCSWKVPAPQIVAAEVAAAAGAVAVAGPAAVAVAVADEMGFWTDQGWRMC